MLPPLLPSRGSSRHTPDGGRMPAATAMRGRHGLANQRLAVAAALASLATDPCGHRRVKRQRPADPNALCSLHRPITAPPLLTRTT